MTDEPKDYDWTSDASRYALMTETAPAKSYGDHCWVCGNPRNCGVKGVCPYHPSGGYKAYSNSQEPIG